MEWILLGVFVLAAVALGVVFWMHHREQHRIAAQFRNSLRHALRKTKLRDFDLLQFANTAGVSKKLACKAGEDLFALFYDQAARDGVITVKERNTIDRLATALCIESHTREVIANKASGDVFRRHAERALSDGKLSQSEADELEELRKRLGLTKDAVYDATRSSAEKSYLAQFRSMLHQGRITQDRVDELLKMRNTFGLSEERAFRVVRRDAEAKYREHFTDIKQDGDITEDDQRSLRTLQRLLGLPDASVARYEQELKWLRYLSDCRRGYLPSVQTERFLEGGEICHFDQGCRFVWQTSAKTQTVNGQLTLTSQRVIFTSMTRNHEFRPSKIADIDLNGNCLRIILSSGRGTGDYYVGRGDLAEAILEAITKKSKYLAVEGFSANATRHIPDRVKQDVWARDGGCCVRCRATDYLEFDHIIPHSKGGANSVKNIQLLCRKCNGEKSDRI